MKSRVYWIEERIINPAPQARHLLVRDADRVNVTPPTTSSPGWVSIYPPIELLGRANSRPILKNRGRGLGGAIFKASEWFALTRIRGILGK